MAHALTHHVLFQKVTIPIDETGYTTSLVISHTHNEHEYQSSAIVPLLQGGQTKICVFLYKSCLCTHPALACMHSVRFGMAAMPFLCNGFFLIISIYHESSRRVFKCTGILSQFSYPLFNFLYFCLRGMVKLWILNICTIK